ncbi:PREDICTED: COBRA-like protein 5 [Tarenaya hassleriana]|uniref:COBRA-like protein 5 n=1 Tax=Tarenaya hassleriana TaxID=28532 RepID=UPI00053C0FE6|nr:PREDICTED: COBRA-like protein 5 [Tarenaya hassleriana]
MGSLFLKRPTLSSAVWVLSLFLSSSCFTSSEAHTGSGNITIKWDLISWTPDGYVAVVSIYNFQKNRPIRRPGWKLSWTWAKKEVIWSMMGARAVNQGDCSRFKGNIPHSCTKNPTVVDLRPGTPFNQQIANCCRGGVLEPGTASSFQLSVGNGGTTEKTVQRPTRFIFTAPGQKYICGQTRNVKPTIFVSPDKRRMTRALLTWNITCLFHKATRMMLETF